MKKPKRLLVLGASNANKFSLMEIAKLPGVKLVVADGNPESVGKSIAHEFEAINITDGNKVLQIAQKHSVNGIYAMNDHALRPAAFASSKMGFKGMPMATAHCALDKGAMREVWKSYGVPQPDFRVITSIQEINEFAKRVGFPLVIKPVDSGGGGRGVLVIENEEQIPYGFQVASGFLQRNNRMIIEEFVEGIETSVEAVIFKGETYLVAFSDKYKPPLQSRVATKINYPGKFPQNVIEKMREISGDALTAIGINEGIGHIEYIVGEDNTVKILEVNARAGGGHTFHPIASHVSGMNYPQWIAEYLLDEADTPDIMPYKGACYYFFYSEKAGTLKNVSGFEQAREIPGVFSIEIWKNIGDKVNILSNSMERTGCIITLCDDRENALMVAEKAASLIKVEIV
jgi:biotin carboxylase